MYALFYRLPNDNFHTYADHSPGSSLKRYRQLKRELKRAHPGIQFFRCLPPSRLPKPTDETSSNNTNNAKKAKKTTKKKPKLMKKMKRQEEKSNIRKLPVKRKHGKPLRFAYDSKAKVGR